MKRKPNLFMRIIFIFFLVFMVLYIMTKTGYYESKINKKTILTEEKIREFENDIKNNEVIDLDSYYTPESPDYSSFASNMGKKISNNVSHSIVNFFTQFGKVAKKLFW